jgi:hypothetical protein
MDQMASVRQYHLTHRPSQIKILEHALLLIRNPQSRDVIFWNATHIPHALELDDENNSDS